MVGERGDVKVVGERGCVIGLIYTTTRPRGVKFSPVPLIEFEIIRGQKGQDRSAEQLHQCQLQGTYRDNVYGYRDRYECK